MTTPDPVDARGARRLPNAIGQGDAAQRTGEPAETTLFPDPSRREALASLVPEIRLFVGLATAAVIIAGLYFGREILVPLALALLLGFLLDPIVAWLKRLGLPRLAAVVVVVALSLGAIGLAGIALGNQVSSLSQQLPTYQSNILSKLRDLRKTALGPGMFDGAVETLKVVKKEVEKAAAETAPEAGSKRRSGRTSRT